MTFARIATGVTAASIMIFVLNQDATAEEINIPVSETCVPDSGYERCTTRFDDGSVQVFWKKWVGSCVDIYFAHPDDSHGDMVRYCQPNEIEPFRIRTN